ncbi:hypothetical protein GCM10023191_033120 [Actinoallomurus oryzae]|uniref:LPXTG cell wall anchor domain-containing protein n=1 Tax=Actinoallomurus oryzae TaxID=502180 RepID=A0ABP8Q063_9ACTN
MAIDVPVTGGPSLRTCPAAGPSFHRSEPGPPPGPPSTVPKGLIMHGGLPFIGFSTIVYGVVGLAVAAGGAVTRFRRRK